MRCPSLSDFPPPPPGRSGWPWTEESLSLPGTMLHDSPWPRVSIVTPSYNQAQFIEETIRSVLLQGYPNLEYIIIDGGSTDGSVDIIRKYEPWLAYWVSEPDQGQADALDKGFSRASGEILGWLNSDDTYTPSAVSAASSFLQEHPEAVLVYSDFYSTDEHGQTMQLNRAESFDINRHLLGNQVAQPTVFLKRKVLQEIEGVDTDFHYVMDYDLWTRIALRFPFGLRPLPGAALATFRMHSQSKSVSQNPAFAPEVFRMLHKVLADPALHSFPLDLQHKILRSTYIKLAILAWRLGQPTGEVQGYLARVQASDPHLEYSLSGLAFGFFYELQVEIEPAEDFTAWDAAVKEFSLYLPRSRRNGFRRAVLARVCLHRANRNYYDYQPSRVRTNLMRAFSLSPILLWNYDWIAIFVESLIGVTNTKRLGRFLRPIRAVLHQER